jgi:hypothetical protein
MDKLETFIPKVNARDLKPDAESPKTKAKNQKLMPSSPYKAVEETRAAAFIPVEPADRNRANLNTALMPTPTEPPPARVRAPDGLPANGGFELATGITWGAYGKPSGAVPRLSHMTKHFWLKPNF